MAIRAPDGAKNENISLTNYRFARLYFRHKFMLYLWLTVWIREGAKSNNFLLSQILATRISHNNCSTFRIYFKWFKDMLHSEKYPGFWCPRSYTKEQPGIYKKQLMDDLIINHVHNHMISESGCSCWVFEGFL